MRVSPVGAVEIIPFSTCIPGLSRALSGENRVCSVAIERPKRLQKSNPNIKLLEKSANLDSLARTDNHKLRASGVPKGSSKFKIFGKLQDIRRE